MRDEARLCYRNKLLVIETENHYCTHANFVSHSYASPLFFSHVHYLFLSFSNGIKLYLIFDAIFFSSYLRTHLVYAITRNQSVKYHQQYSVSCCGNWPHTNRFHYMKHSLTYKVIIWHREYICIIGFGVTFFSSLDQIQITSFFVSNNIFTTLTIMRARMHARTYQKKNQQQL